MQQLEAPRPPFRGRRAMWADTSDPADLPAAGASRPRGPRGRLRSGTRGAIARRARATILVVDDQEDILDSLKIVLETGLDGVDVVVATSAERALAVLESRRVDLVITDLRMPEMDGVELVQCLRARRRDLPVFLMTAYADSERAETARASAEIQEFFAKPFDSRDLVAMARRYLAG